MILSLTNQQKQLLDYNFGNTKCNNTLNTNLVITQYKYKTKTGKQMTLINFIYQ
ncbi:hypothetical protein EHRUM4_04340 [Ehrlichia ruminantium]|uniref:Uncharacterized protein n=1 Tax=Ehrlichia ruminantium TaxID=779 RepID=A0A161MP24_EHRRU|nr:hypothetical protein EHRUM4_04340 [Ehrlichia ruminantium]GAT77213.1 hypothetical protein EHRUM2_04270 [Ehrlichia ruminantium]GAT78304.1 hypothetical protein EHRUM3_05210 [Ehrlichia ruminantium]